MKMAALVAFALLSVLLLVGNTAEAQDAPVPSVTLEVQAAANCVVRIFANDLGPEVVPGGPFGALRGYDFKLGYPAGVTVTAAPVNTWYDHNAAIQFIATCAAGECRLVTFGLSPGVSGSGPLQELTLTGTGTGLLAFTDPTSLAGYGGAVIAHTDGVGIDVETCEATAVSGPLRPHAGAGGGAFFAAAALALMALSGLGLRRARR